jgi:hypothetical protein
MTQGIKFEITGNPNRGNVQSYHCKPSALKINKGHKVDVSGLKKVEQRQLISFEDGEYSTKFTIGFEVEKNQLSRGAVKEYPLFCGFERDGSCGYEAVTHILPLLPASMWRTKVFNMFKQAEKIIDDRYSPSDRRCGGHVTIGVEGLTGDEVRQLVRKNCGIVFALFKGRLKNHYCRHNLRMESAAAPSHFNGWDGKYQLALTKSFGLEFRVVSKFESVKQIMRRYELFYELVNFSVNSPNGSFANFLKKVEPIVLSMYEGNAEKTAEVLKLAKHFQDFINTGNIHQDIEQYIR